MCSAPPKTTQSTPFLGGPPLPSPERPGSTSSAFLGSLLNVKPILHVKDGLMVPFQKVRGKKMAVKRIVELVKERSLGHPEQLIAISHADDPKAADQLEGSAERYAGLPQVSGEQSGQCLGLSHRHRRGQCLFVNTTYPEPNISALPRPVEINILLFVNAELYLM